jgi:curved DNA-binding protein
MAAEDLYTVLGVPKGADEADIKKSYRKLAKTLHPDKNPGDAKAEARFKTVNHAFDVLSDPKKRKLYDEFGEEGLREGFDAEKVRAYSQWSRQRGASPGGGGGGARSAGGVRIEDLFSRDQGQTGDFSEFIGDIFSRGQRKPRGPTPGGDLQASVTIDFASAVRGTMVELHVQNAAAGASAEPLKVRIPQGADEGSRVRITGQGAPSPNGGPSGDLLLDIHVSPHKFFRREEDDLHLDLPITVVEAIRGGKVKVPTIDGSVSLKVTPGTQTGASARLKGKGVTRKGHTGDLYVHYQVHVPTQTTPALDALLDALEKSPLEDPRADLVL